jgi:hypothetical protein
MEVAKKTSWNLKNQGMIFGLEKKEKTSQITTSSTCDLF